MHSTLDLQIKLFFDKAPVVVNTLNEIFPQMCKAAGITRKKSHCLRVTCASSLFNPMTPEDFHVFEWFSAFTHPIGFRDSIFKVTIKGAAVLKH